MDRRRYVSSLVFRLSLIILALLLGLRATYVAEGGPKAWILAGLFGVTAAALMIRPLLVPNGTQGSVPYSLGPAFFLAGLFLVPAGPLVASIAFAIALSGLVTATRPHKILFNLSVAVLTYAAPSLLMRLGSHGANAAIPGPDLVGVEVLLSAAVLVCQLLLRSVALRLERGHETPHWGAFQGPALVEAFYCLALSVPISVLARIHVALLAFVYLNIGVTWWFMERYRLRVRALAQTAETMDDPDRRVA